MENSVDKVVQIGRARLDRDQDIIILDTPGGDYEIELSECRTPEEIEDWTQHLSERSGGPKSVMILRRFSRPFNLNPGGLPGRIFLDSIRNGGKGRHNV